MKTPIVTSFFVEATYTASHILTDPDGPACAVIDPVLDFDPASGRTSTDSAQKIIDHIRSNKLQLQWIFETHVHADHLSAGPAIREALGGKIAIGSHIQAVQNIFGKLFNLNDEFARDGSQFDHLIEPDEPLSVGELSGYAIHTPGHTPACMTYVFGDVAFVGDTLFMPDYGSARADFPGGDAGTLYRSIQRLYELPPETRVFLCHDYKAPGRDHFRWETTIADERNNNIHVNNGMPEQEFVQMRDARDKTLAVPRLLLPSVQVNMRAGMLPPAEDNGTHYLKIPLNTI